MSAPRKRAGERTADTQGRKIDVAPAPLCEWFALCTNVATGYEPHPILGEVPICDRCREKIERIRGELLK